MSGYQHALASLPPGKNIGTRSVEFWLEPRQCVCVYYVCMQCVCVCLYVCIYVYIMVWMLVMIARMLNDTDLTFLSHEIQ